MMKNDGYVTFRQAPAIYFKRAFDYSGRSTRSEYWWMAVWDLVIAIIPVSLVFTGTFPMVLMDHPLQAMVQGDWWIALVFLLYIVWLFPDIAQTVRRVRDAGGPTVIGYLVVLTPVLAILHAQGILPATGGVVNGIDMVITLVTLYYAQKPSQVAA